MVRSRSWIAGLTALVLLVLAATAALLLPGRAPAVAAGAGAGAGAGANVHVGVASCSGSTCHGRSEGDGAVVRQDELMRWQDPSSPAGAHARAWTVLKGARSRAIAARLGLGDPAAAPMCLGCHADPAPARGPRFQLSDGVGCEACHGGAGDWIASHTSVGATHAQNVARGMVPLERAAARASNCLDCHFGSDRPGQFVDHRIMAAGHPRISYELDLFSTLEQHWNEDGDYRRRKGAASNIRMWAVGQAMAVERALALYASPARGQEGTFPEFYFFDCHSCHRRISDQADFRATAPVNPGRPIPSGMPPFNDENMIMLSAAARATAPAQAARFDADARAFHAALAQGRPQAVQAAGRLRQSAAALAAAFSAAPLGPAQAFAMIDAIASAAITPRFTDYEGSVQAVMAVDTLLSSLVNGGAVPRDRARAIRGDVDRAYQAVRDPNAYRPADFRAALGRAASAIRTLG